MNCEAENCTSGNWSKRTMGSGGGEGRERGRARERESVSTDVCVYM